MNQEIYPQVYRTTEAMGTDQTPTPISISVSKHGEDYYVNAEGADGQQVADVVSIAIRQLTGGKPEHILVSSGFRDFAIGLLIISSVTVAIVNIYTLANPSPTTPTSQIKKWNAVYFSWF